MRKKKLPLSKLFSFEVFVPISLIRLIFHYSCFQYFSRMLYIMVKGHSPTMPIVSNQTFHLKDHFYLFLARCHCILLTKEKKKKSILSLQFSPIGIMTSWKSLTHFKEIRTRTSIFTLNFLNMPELNNCNPFSNQKVASTLKVWAVLKQDGLPSDKISATIVLCLSTQPWISQPEICV